MALNDRWHDVSGNTVRSWFDRLPPKADVPHHERTAAAYANSRKALGRRAVCLTLVTAATYTLGQGCDFKPKAFLIR